MTLTTYKKIKEENGTELTKENGENKIEKESKCKTQKHSFPYEIKPLNCNEHNQVVENFADMPNGLKSVTPWGFKVAGSTTKKQMDYYYNYPLKSNDIWLLSSPKSGTHWMAELVWLIATNLNYTAAKKSLYKRWIMYDVYAMLDKNLLEKTCEQLPENHAKALRNSIVPRPDNLEQNKGRFIRSHLPLSIQNPRLLETCKVVYVARNPKDACVSYFKHFELFSTFRADFDTFVKQFINGNILATPTIPHVLEAWNQRNHPNLLFVFYEDLKGDLRGQIRRVAEFLDKSLSDQDVEGLYEHLHIDNFKKNPYVFDEKVLKESGFMKKDRKFVRNGKTGDWKNHLSPELNDKMNKLIENSIKGSDLNFITDLKHQD